MQRYSYFIWEVWIFWVYILRPKAMFFISHPFSLTWFNFLFWFFLQIISWIWRLDNFPFLAFCLWILPLVHQFHTCQKGILAWNLISAMKVEKLVCLINEENCTTSPPTPILYESKIIYWIIYIKYFALFWQWYGFIPW